MAIVTIPKLVMQSWKSKAQKQLINASVWESISNRQEVSAIIPNGGTKSISDSVVMYVSDQFKDGIFKTTIPSVDKLKRKGSMGWQKVQGTEERPQMRYKSIHYNVQRKGIALVDDSIDGDVAKGYEAIKQGNQFLTDYFAELGDYDKQRTILEGAPEHLTEEYAWVGSSSFSSAPVTVKLHPTIYYKGATKKVTYSANQTTYRNNLTTALLGMEVTDKFEKFNLDSLVSLAQKHCIPLSWKSGDNQDIKWIAKISQVQADQLMNTTDSAWNALYSNSDVRSVKNRAISGVVGVYRGILLLVDPRAPVFNAKTKAFQYQKPWEEADELGNYVNEVVRNPYSTKGSADSSVAGYGATFEIAQVMGRGAIGSARIKELSFNNESFDYDFSKGSEARRACGDERMDFYINDETAEEPKNWTSFLYFTPTPSNTY